MVVWLVVLTILKNISQWEGLSHILWKIKMFQTTNQLLVSTHLNFRVVSLFLRPEALFFLVHVVHNQQPQTLAVYT